MVKGLYVITIEQDGRQKYLMSKKATVHAKDFAIGFSAPAKARQYLEASNFAALEYTIERIEGTRSEYDY